METHHCHLERKYGRRGQRLVAASRVKDYYLQSSSLPADCSSESSFDTTKRNSFINGTKIRLASGQALQVDWAVCFHIVNLDHSLMSLEYTAREELLAASNDEFAFLEDIAEDLRAGGDKLFKMMEF
jgi:hypothetical protein